jgi:hypothetical protein
MPRRRRGSSVRGGVGSRLAQVAAQGPRCNRGEIDVLPAKRRDMGEDRLCRGLAAAAEGIEGSRQVYRVPQRDGRDEVQATCPVFLAFEAPISDATQAMEADGARQSVFDSPLFSSAVAWRRRIGLSSQSSVNMVRSMRSILRRASASPFWRG